MDSQRCRGVYIGVLFASIIKYIEPMIGDVFTARLVDCHFGETVFPLLGQDKKQNLVAKEQQKYKLTWHTPTLSPLGSRTLPSENEI